MPYQLSDLTTKGYVLIPNFLNFKELKAFQSDYKNLNKFLQYQDEKTTHDLSRPSNKLLTLFKNKISKITNNLKLTTSIDRDMCQFGEHYLNTNTVNFGWHQDHGQYYLFQQLYNSLNFYIIVEKEKSDMSGLSIIPFDILNESVPNQIHKIVNRGAMTYFPHENSTTVKDDNTGEEFTLPININDIKVSPKISAGDLLLLRGDIIHKTQDNLSHRIAISIRATDSNAPINKSELLSGCEYKIKFIKNNPQTFLPAVELFDILKKDSITAEEYQKYITNKG